MRSAIPGFLAMGLALLAATAGGCLETDMQMPGGFVPVPRGDLGGYRARGVSADGVVVALRAETDARGGTLDFWSHAIENELTAGRGYRLQSAQEVTAGNSTARGRLLTFAVRRQGVAYTYAVAVFVASGKVLVAEAGGREDACAKHAPALRQALLSVR